jgi:hypothetical protein
MKQDHVPQPTRPCRRPVLIAFLAGGVCLGALRAHDADQAPDASHAVCAPASAGQSSPVAANRASAVLPPLPADVVDLKFHDFYRLPLGPRGLELTEQVKALDGRKVRILGYMTQYSHAVPGTLLLTPYAVKMDDCHYGLADDLPPQTLHVTVPRLAGQKIAFRPGPLLLTGLLEVGPKEQPDGRNFAVRLVLDETTPAGVAAASGDEAAAEHTACPTCRRDAGKAPSPISADRPPQAKP